MLAHEPPPPPPPPPEPPPPPADPPPEVDGAVLDADVAAVSEEAVHGPYIRVGAGLGGTVEADTA
jgi:hypothetical protein